jgi:hypothetical protein
MSAFVFFSILDELREIHHFQPTFHWLHQMDRTSAACDSSCSHIILPFPGHQQCVIVASCHTVKQCYTRNFWRSPQMMCPEGHP